MKKYSDFLKLLHKISCYESACALISWDMETIIPKKAVEKRSEVIGELCSKSFELFVSEQMKEYLDYYSVEENKKILDKDQKKIVELVKKDFDEDKKIPPELVKKISIITSKGQAKWAESKSKSNFSIFQDTLEEIIDLNILKAEKLGYKNNRYDALLNEFEPDLTCEKIDEIISYIKPELIKIINQQEENSKIKYEFMTENYNLDGQRTLSNKIMHIMNFDFEAGLIAESVHPFTTGIGLNDTRITTNYKENNFMDTLYSTIHETGHALYDQGLLERYHGTPLGESISMAIHESQSRFWENIIGRSESFVEYLYPEVIKVFPKFKNVKKNEFYKAINKVEKSLIRTEADEVTYNLHIILRYEIEKALINKEISVSELPKIWNEKCKEYFGIVPKNDTEGVLQDIHWAGGMFGYFPSYMLGNLYSAQMYYIMKKDIKDIEEQIKKGNFKEILDWLRTNVHQYGRKYTPEELIIKISGEPLNGKYFIDYLKDKYSKI